jgi:hypothetical protein
MGHFFNKFEDYQITAIKHLMVKAAGYFKIIDLSDFQGNGQNICFLHKRLTFCRTMEW